MSIPRNAAYNIAGFVVPALLGLVTVPLYLGLIGPERYGVLALGWLLLGYFGVFDLGLGRAATQRIAALRDGTAQERATALTSALAANMAVSLAGAALLAPIAWYVFAKGVDPGPDMRGEVLAAAPLLALGLPVATTIGLLAGALKGRERFGRANGILVVSSSLFLLVPLAVAAWRGPDLSGLLLAAIGARMVGLVLLWRACRAEFGPIALRRWDRRQVAQLLSFGGWVSVSGMIAPLLAFADRFLIGSLIGAAAIAVYTVPMDLMQRFAGFSVALSGALFPRLAVVSREEADALSNTAIATFYAVLTPVVAAGLFLADPAMRLWLGEEIGAQSGPLARLFLIAFWLNSFAQVPWSRLQAIGRPDVVTKLYLAEAPLYLAGLWFALDRFGLVGAGWAYLLRMAADAVLLSIFAQRNFSHWPTIGLTFALFAAAALWLDRVGSMGLPAAIGLAAGAGIAMLIPARALAPMRLAEFRAMLRQRKAL